MNEFIIFFFFSIRSDSYEDSLKNSSECHRRTAIPKFQSFRRSIRANPTTAVGHRGIRHSFSGVIYLLKIMIDLFFKINRFCCAGIRDDLVQGSPGLMMGGGGGGGRHSATRTSFTDLEERLRNLERSFREPFHLNNTNSRC